MGTADYTLVNQFVFTCSGTVLLALTVKMFVMVTVSLIKPAVAEED